MNHWIELLRVFNFLCYFISVIILVYKGVLSNIVNGRLFDWVKFILLCHLVLGFFSIGELILTSTTSWGARTLVTPVVALATLWVVLFKVRAADEHL